MPGLPRHLDAPHGGWRFALHHRPAAGKAAGPIGQIVYVHPWAEELNRTRRMAALQARALAEAGFEVLQIDLLGCGDSSGDFADATWASWLDDVALAVRTLRAGQPAAEAPPLWLWGLRAGALVAAEATRRHAAEFGPCHFLFWQPTPSGSAVLNAFLRQATLGQRAQGRTEASTTALREQLLAGEPAEVAGYTLSPGLARGLNAATLAPAELISAPSTPGTSPRLVWLEVQATAGDAAPTLLPAGLATRQAWQDTGFNVQADAVPGPAFWQTVEIEEAPALLAATLQLLHANRVEATP